MVACLIRRHRGDAMDSLIPHKRDMVREGHAMVGTEVEA